jgi:tetratricopeptide (TPR) repeat protein
VNRIIPIFIFLTLFLVTVSAQVRFSATTERTHISMDEQVVITATLTTNRQSGISSIPPVSSTDGFTVLKTDQRQSSSSSIQIINGRASQKTEIHHIFYYYIAPSKVGSFTFPSLEVTVDGKSYKTEPIVFTVRNEAVANPDIRVFLQLNKRSLYVGEQAMLTFKVAQKVQSSTDVNNGFMSALEKLENAFESDFALSRLFTNQISTTQERIDGEIYKVYSLRYALYPVNSGTFNIQSIPFGYQELRRVRSRRSDPFFDDFFDMNSFFGGGVQAVDKNALSNSLSITVKPLPSAPSGFSGSVGKFSLSASVDPKQVPAGEAITLKISLKGSTRPGSIGDIILPQLSDCEVFKPEQQMITDTSVNGITTRKTYKYLLIPRKEGTLVIPPVSLIYFDPESGSYKSASSDTIKITISKGKENIASQNRYLTQEEIREVGKDIRYIKTGIKIKNQQERPYREPFFYLLFPIPFIIFIFSLLYRFQSSRQKRNATQQIRRRAFSAAQKKLSTLKKKHTSLSSSQFLGAVSETIEQYISQKFGFAATGRTLDELKNELLSQNADQQTVAELTAFIEDLNGYRFGGLTLDDSSRISVLDKTSRFLSGLQKSSKKGGAVMSRTLAVFLGCLFIFSSAFSAPVDHWFEKANQAYSNEQYDSAAFYYEKIVESGISNSAIFYNLGNTAFRQKKIGLARYYFEKAAKLDPQDPDIISNIRFIKANIIDKTPEQERGFLENLLWHLHIFFPLKTQLWILFSLLLTISILLSLSLYFSGNGRLWLIYFSVLLSLVIVITGISAAVKVYELEKTSYAILLSPSSEARNEPDGNKVLFTAHEGTKFQIRKINGSWALVSLPNGVSGWIELKNLGKI